MIKEGKRHEYRRANSGNRIRKKNNQSDAETAVSIGNRIGAVFFSIIAALQALAFTTEDTVHQARLYSFASLAYVVSILAYMYNMNYLTKSLNVLSVILVVIIVINIIVGIYSRCSYRLKQVVLTDAVTFVIVAVGFLMFLGGKLHFDKIKDYGKEMDDYHIEKEIYFCGDALNIPLPEWAYEETNYTTKYNVALVNMFCDEDEKYVADKLVDEYVNLIEGKGSWSTLLQFEERYDEIEGIFYEYNDYGFDDLKWKVREKIDEMGQLPYADDYTEEELEEIIRHVYSEMQGELPDLGVFE